MIKHFLHCTLIFLCSAATFHAQKSKAYNNIDSRINLSSKNVDLKLFSWFAAGQINGEAFRGQPLGNWSVPRVPAMVALFQSSSTKDADWPEKLPFSQEDFWNELQKAETLLVQSSRKINLNRPHPISEIELDQKLKILLIRIGSGLPKDGFVPEDYLLRAPYGDKDKLVIQLNSLVDHGFLTGNVNKYALTAKAKTLLAEYVQFTMKRIDSLPIPILDDSEITALIDFDKILLHGLHAGSPENKSRILINRESGITSGYKSQRISEHWQLVWTMLAALQDEEEDVRIREGIKPVEWFTMKQYWYKSRKPWLIEKITAETIAENLENYVPMNNALEQVNCVVSRAIEKGLMLQLDDVLNLNEEVLKRYDKYEKVILNQFFKRWPVFEEAQLMELYATLRALNNWLENTKT